MKFHMDESESFKELYLTKENSRSAYVKSYRALMEKKEKLFKKQDLYKWGGF
jgi:hypothetical protein